MSYLMYPALAEWDEATRAWSLRFPDFPEICSFTNRRAEIPQQAADALLTAIEVRREDGEALPDPTADLGERVRDWPPASDNMQVFVTVPAGPPPESEPVRVNVSLDRRLLERIDGAAGARGMSRSGFLAEGARAMLQGDGPRPAPRG